MENAPMKERQTDFGEIPRAVTSLFVSLVLFGMAVLFFFAGEGGVFTYVSALPAILGLLVFYTFFHSLFASRTPPTTLLLALDSLPRGKDIPYTIRQYGPVRLESLRGRLVCEKSVRRDKSRDLTYPYQIEIFDTGPVEVALHDTMDHPATLHIPADAEPTTDQVGLRIEWRIEIWGKVIGRADFMRPFRVVVE
jgi:hypothetical protein